MMKVQLPSSLSASELKLMVLVAVVQPWTAYTQLQSFAVATAW